ncbi:hypothetical protein [Haloarcula onubensis]|uniref:Uncharacterized protein n=1 Tax=Haloarcula onubensis TaxID=2950539 RepID=A0ABU2FJ85_9EURY|nr:hypothetical protein [Halomicroarcula sp. S3CR25-11]MDS0280815.1 hypothetical protein [Halomicroarcula sp. S3CR25-11]
MEASRFTVASGVVALLGCLVAVEGFLGASEADHGAASDGERRPKGTTSNGGGEDDGDSVGYS